VLNTLPIRAQCQINEKYLTPWKQLDLECCLRGQCQTRPRKPTRAGCLGLGKAFLL